MPILTREAIEYEDFETGHVKRIDHKVNNKLNNSFDSDIVDTKVGYLFGHPITYEFDDKRETGTTSSGKQMIDDFNTLNNIADEDSEWGRWLPFAATERGLHISTGTVMKESKTLNHGKLFSSAMGIFMNRNMLCVITRHITDSKSRILR